MYKRVLAKCWNKLIEDIDTDGLLDKMIEHEFFTPVKLRDLREIRTTSNKIREILSAVSSAGPEKFNLFRLCLTESQQSHIIDLLDNTERALLQEGDGVDLR